MLSTEKIEEKMTDQEYFEKYSHAILVLLENEEWSIDILPIDYEKKDRIEILKAKTESNLSEILISTSEWDMWVNIDNILLEN